MATKKSEAVVDVLVWVLCALIVILVFLLIMVFLQKADLWPWPAQRQEESPYTVKEILGGYYDGSAYHLRIIDRFSDGRLWERDVVIPQNKTTRDIGDSGVLWDFGSNVRPRFHIRAPKNFISNEPAQ